MDIWAQHLQSPRPWLGTKKQYHNSRGSHHEARLYQLARGYLPPGMCKFDPGGDVNQIAHHLEFKTKSATGLRAPDLLDCQAAVPGHARARLEF
jgi:hypothetical protein